MKKTIQVALIIFLIGCSSEPSSEAVNNSISNNELAKELSPEERFTNKTGKFYDCNASYTVETIGGEKSITTILESGEFLDLMEPDMVTSRTCFVLFKQLRDSSEITYDVFKCIVLQSNGDTIKNTYLQKQLEMFELKADIANQFSTCLETDDYNSAFELFNPEVPGISSDALKSSFQPLTEHYGKVITTRLVGFSTLKNKEINGKYEDIFLVNIAQEREHEIVNIGLLMTANVNDSYIYGIE